MITAQPLAHSKEAVKYYTEYCIEGGEKPGVWYGGGAHALSDPSLPGSSLNGATVMPLAMERLAQGFSPSGTALVQNAGEEHAMGVDFTFSAPKSVSIVWATANEKTKEIVENAHNEAAKVALDYLEHQSGHSRAGKGGKIKVKAENIFALFQHSSSRAGDPQLHTHAIMFNVAYCEDSKFRTLQYSHYYKRKMAAGALYKAELAHRLKTAGFELRRTKHSFEIKGVSQKLIDFRSTRSKEIEKLAEQSGLDRSSASIFAKQKYNFITRNKYDKDSRVDFETWRREHKEMGLSSAKIEGMRSSTFIYKGQSKRFRKNLIKATGREIIDQRSTFPAYVYLRKMAERSIGKLSTGDIFQSSFHGMMSDLIRLQKTYDDNVLTTKWKYQEEDETVRMFKRRIGENRHSIKLHVVQKIIKEENERHSKLLGKEVKLSPDQLQTVVATATNTDGISLISGVAGSGKTFALQYLEKIYEQTGHKLTALAPTHKAAQTIERDVKINATTVHSFLYKNSVQNRKQILVVDEAAMLASKYYNRIFRKAEKMGCKVLLIGDTKQVQPVEAGQMFGTLQNKFDGSELSTVRRQSDPEEAKTILGIREGKVDETFQFYEKKGYLHVETDQNEAEASILKRWKEFRSSNPQKTSLILATTNLVVGRLNEKIRSHLKAEGALGKSYFFKRGRAEFEVARGDRLIFTENRKAKGIINSDIVEVVDVNSIFISVKKDDGTLIKFNPASFSGFKYGYAVTSNKSQSMTVDKAFVVVDGNLMDRERFYVSLSRGRADNEIFINSVNFPDLSEKQQAELNKLPKGEYEKRARSMLLENVAKEVSVSHMKDTSKDYALNYSPYKALDRLQFALKQNLKSLTEGKDIYFKK